MIIITVLPGATNGMCTNMCGPHCASHMLDTPLEAYPSHGAACIAMPHSATGVTCVEHCVRARMVVGGIHVHMYTQELAGGQT